MTFCCDFELNLSVELKFAVHFCALTFLAILDQTVDILSLIPIFNPGEQEKEVTIYVEPNK